MNKLMGFYELKRSSLPTIPWQEYTGEQTFNENQLWTIRTAVFQGNDLNLPRFVGINSNEARKQANCLYEKYRDNGMVVYYPYFIAVKSGTLNVFNDSVVIEAVNKDLWNLVTYSNREVTIIQKSKGDIEYIGNNEFLLPEELSELLKNVPRIKGLFKEYFLEGKSILLEWSFAYNCDTNKNKIGDKYLVFYEARTT